MKSSGRVGEQEDTASLELAFVLFVDIVSFPTRPTAKQPGVVSALERMVEAAPAYQNAVASRQVRRLSIGDGFAFVFLAVNLAAFRVGSQLRKASSQSPPDLRIGLHFGPVQLMPKNGESGNYLGEGMNTCARLITSAAPGEFLVSESAERMLLELGVEEEEFVYLGPERAKHGQSVTLYKVVHEEAVRKRGEGAKRLNDLAFNLREKALRKQRARVAPTQTIAARLQAIRRDTVFGLALLLAVLAVHKSIEVSDVGQRVEFAAYDWLLGFVSPSPGDLPVTVVDFRENINLETRGLESKRTDLEKLRAVVAAVLKYKPASVAIDMNFGPQARSEDSSEVVYLDEGSNLVPWLMAQHSLTRIPIHLGTTLPAPGSPDLLSDPQATEMAVHCFVPSDARAGQIFMFGPVVYGSQVLKGLSQAISDDYARAHGERTAQSGLLLTPYSHDELTTADRALEASGKAPLQLMSEEFFVNYADESTLAEGAVVVGKDLDLESLAGVPLTQSEMQARLNGKAVIIGSTTTEGDVFRQPRTDKKTSGLMLLALAAESRLRSPLFEFTPIARIFMHMVSGLVVLGTILGIRLCYLTDRKDIAASRLSFALTGLVALATVSTGILLVRFTRTLWNDFFLVIFLLLLHPRIENWIERLAGAFRGWFRDAWRQLLFQGSPR